MASRGKMLVELALKKAWQQQDDQTVVDKPDERVQKTIYPAWCMSII